MVTTKSNQLKLKLRGKRIVKKPNAIFKAETFTPIDKLDHIILSFRKKNK